MYKVLKSLTIILFSLLIVFQILGCGALFNSSPQTVTCTSEPSGAKVWVDGQLHGTAPIALKLTKKEGHTITFKMEGKEDRSYILNPRVNAGYVILDVLFGLVPVIVDAAAGTWYSLDDSSIHGVLTDKQKSLLQEKTNIIIGKL